MPKTQQRDVVVIGASAGGVEAVCVLARRLPRLEASLFVVVHTGPAGPGMLAQVLARRGKWPAEVAEHDMPFEHGNIYVAPPDLHLALEPGRMRLVRGPLENRHRPSVDALFRSAAASLGPRVIGVVLTGYFDDGTAGAIAIKRRGGIVIAQDPEDALVPGMPESVISTGQIDYVARLEEIPGLIQKLVREAVPTLIQRGSEQATKHVENESVDPTGFPSAYTCPECNGTLWEVEDGGLLRLACRVGHTFSADSMMEDQNESAERALWAALRALQERTDLAGRMAKRASDRGLKLAAKRYIEVAESTAHDAEVLRNMLTNGKPSQVRERHDPGRQEQIA